MMWYIRLRDVTTGSERWLDDRNGQHFRCSDRQTADCCALAMSRLGLTELAYVVEVDETTESI